MFGFYLTVDMSGNIGFGFSQCAQKEMDIVGITKRHPKFAAATKELARLWIQIEKHSEAEKLIESLKEQSLLLDALFLEAMLLRREKKLGEARNVFRRLVGLDAENGDLLNDITKFYLDEGDYDGAEEFSEVWATRQSSDPRERECRIRVLLGRGLFKEALGSAEEALSRWPGLQAFEKLKGTAIERSGGPISKN